MQNKRDGTGLFYPGIYTDEAIDYLRSKLGEEKFELVMGSDNARAHPYVVARLFLSQADWNKYVYIEQHGSLDGYKGMIADNERRYAMGYRLCTLGRKDVELFKDRLPEHVLHNLGKRGIFMLGSVDEELRVIGVTQFSLRVLPGGDAVADVIYVFVLEEFRGNGVASSMINEIHRIVKKSGGNKSLAFIKKMQKEQQLFQVNGYLFISPETETIVFLEDVHESIVPSRTEQGVYYVSRGGK